MKGISFPSPPFSINYLAKTQKVDLTKISITKLADQFLEYIKESINLNLELAAEYLLTVPNIE